MSLNTMRESFKRSAKWVMGFVTVAMVITTFSNLGSSLRGNSSSSAAPSGEDVVATVNGIDIKRAEYETQINNMRQQQQMMGQPSSIMQDGFMGIQSFDKLLQTKLDLQAAEKQGLTVSDDDVKKRREEIVTQADFRTKLSLPKTASLADVDAALLKNGAAPLSERFSDDDLRQQILLQKLEDKVKHQVPVTEQDVRNSYRQYHTRHILVDNKTRSDEQAQKRAQEILAKAKAPGADFAALAKQSSDDPGTKAKGGDDGWIDQNTGYVEEFKKAAFTLQPGQVTPDLVKSAQFGYFIIKLDETRENLPKDFDKNKATLTAQFTETRQSKAWQDFEKSLKDDPSVKITINDPAIRGGHAIMQSFQAKDQPARDALMKAAMADYQKSLAQNSKGVDAAATNVLLGQIAGQLHQEKDAINYFNAALASSNDAQVHMVLGNLYMKQKDDKNAVTQFQAASKAAWDDQQIHQSLMMSYMQMKRMDLVKQEQTWMSDYQKSHPQPASNFGGPGGPGGPSGAPIVIPSPSGAHAGKVTVGAAPPAAASGAPVAVHATPGGAPVVVNATPGGTPVTVKAAGGAPVTVKATTGTAPAAVKATAGTAPAAPAPKPAQ